MVFYIFLAPNDEMRPSRPCDMRPCGQASLVSWQARDIGLTLSHRQERLVHQPPSRSLRGQGCFPKLQASTKQLTSTAYQTQSHPRRIPVTVKTTMAPSSNAASPLMPRSPSNINANMSPSRAKSLAMRKSISKPHTAHSQPPPRPPADFDMAEQMNEEISNKYVKGPSNRLHA